MWKCFQKIWYKYFIQVDTFVGLVIGWVVSWLLITNNWLQIGNFEFLNIAEIYFTLWWFLFSIFALIFSFKDWKRLERLQKSSQYKKIFDIFFDAIILYMLFAVLFLMANYLNLLDIDVYLIIFYISIPILSVKTYRSIRIIRKMAELTLSDE